MTSRHLLFDFDGTLVDSSASILASLDAAAPWGYGQFDQATLSTARRLQFPGEIALLH